MINQNEPCSKKRKIESAVPCAATPSSVDDQVKAIVESFLGQLNSEKDDTLIGCGTAALSIMSMQPQAVLDLSHEKMHAFPYHAVPTCWRRLYEDSSCHLAVSILQSEAFSA